MWLAIRRGKLLDDDAFFIHLSCVCVGWHFKRLVHLCMHGMGACIYCLSLVYSKQGHSQFLPPAITASPPLIARTLCLSKCVGGVQTQQRTRGEGVSTKRMASAQMSALCSEKRAGCANSSLQQVSEFPLSLSLSLCMCVYTYINIFR